MPTTTLAAITPEEVQAYFGIDDKKALIKVVQPLVQDYIESYSNDDFLSTTRTEKPVIRDSFQKDFFTKHHPIASVTSVTETSTTLTADTDYFAELETGRIEKYSNTSSVLTGVKTGSYWSTIPNDITIVYVGGTDLAGVQDIVLAYYELCGVWASLNTRIIADIDGEQTAITTRNIPKSIMMILDRHRRRNA